MLPTPRRALVWIGIWLALAAVGWLFIGLFDGRLSENAGASLLLAMAGAAIITYALQVGTFAVEAATFVTRLAIDIVRWSRSSIHRLLIVVGLCATIITLGGLLLAWFGPRELTSTRAVSLGLLVVVVLSAVPFGLLLLARLGDLIWFFFDRWKALRK
jgi:hypothetical protein